VKQPGTEYFSSFSSFSGTALAVSSLVGTCVRRLCFVGGGLSFWSAGSFGASVEWSLPWLPEAKVERVPPGIVDRGALLLRSVRNWPGQVTLAWLPWLLSVPVLAPLLGGIFPWGEGVGNNPALGVGLLIRAGP